jgi:DUF4097 and DUF4098 domain-containing protein YvlB
MTNRRHPVLGLCAVLFLASPLFAKMERVISETYEVEPGGLVYLQIPVGDIEVSAGSSDTVMVKAKITLPKARSEDDVEEVLEALDLQMSQSDEGVRVTAKQVKGKSHWIGWGNSNRVYVDLKVIVPSHYNVEARTSGGDIEVENLTGQVKARTSGGDVEVGHIKGDVDVGTSGGDIDIEHVVGSVHAHTSGGDVKVEEAEGPVVAGTSGGDVFIGRVQGTLQASTSGGDIKAHLDGPLTEDAELGTSGGDVTLWIDEAVGLNLDARTSGGDVRADGVTLKIKSGGSGKGKLVGEVNGGGPRLKLRSSGGDVRVKTS